MGVPREILPGGVRRSGTIDTPEQLHSLSERAFDERAPRVARDERLESLDGLSSSAPALRGECSREEVVLFPEIRRYLLRTGRGIRRFRLVALDNARLHRMRRRSFLRIAAARPLLTCRDAIFLAGVPHADDTLVDD